MGKIIEDLFTYGPYRITECVAGSYIHSADRGIKKHEKKIDKAIEFAEKNNCTVHISLQQFRSFLGDKSLHESNERSYYPFLVELEPDKENGDSDYKECVALANILCDILTKQYEVNPDDIVRFINNSRSIYVMVNPKTYRLQPAANLHYVYSRMWKRIMDEYLWEYCCENYIDIEKYVDNSMFSSYKLIKCPNTRYKGGFFVNISDEELMALEGDISLKRAYTKKRRPLDKELPAEYSEAFHKLYLECQEEEGQKPKPEKKARKEDIINLSDESILRAPVDAGCVDFMLNNAVPSGCQSHALVSIAIYYYHKGLSKKACIELLEETAGKWPVDGAPWNQKQFKDIVSCVYRKGYNFSCSRVNDVMKFDASFFCSKCPYSKDCGEKKEEFPVYAEHIRKLFDAKYGNRKVGLRYYVLYLQICRKQLLTSKEYFNPKEYGVSVRLLQELTSILGLDVIKSGTLIKINFTPAEKGVYHLPNGFVDNKVYELPGQRLKQYLMLLTLGYSLNKNSIQVTQQKATVMKLLKLTSSAYSKMMSSFEKLGLVNKRTEKSFWLYYKPYNVAYIEQGKNTGNKVKTGLTGNKKLANRKDKHGYPVARRNSKVMSGQISINYISSGAVAHARKHEHKLRGRAGPP